ncbi:hypothetical protein RFI_25266 [Reticulomyxa filosa]|uniref:Uncharacterized protein n=1 Tax=Reticulomyxa filosa TaxID=46433 RepID=X6MGD0_RETFI|nr:hypothetical protein RFI_25266 [Reticulomyxa filosa]|eukprot:ETO12110.1 hypothetical protein RFI_25266 [Reticulomyxa filosa]
MNIPPMEHMNTYNYISFHLSCQRKSENNDIKGKQEMQLKNKTQETKKMDSIEYVITKIICKDKTLVLNQKQYHLLSIKKFLLDNFKIKLKILLKKKKKSSYKFEIHTDHLPITAVKPFKKKKEKNLFFICILVYQFFLKYTVFKNLSNNLKCIHL